MDDVIGLGFAVDILLDLRTFVCYMTDGDGDEET